MNVAKKLPISIKKKLKCRMTNENGYFALVLVGHRVKMFYSRWLRRKEEEKKYNNN